ncbi:5' nucleotidase, NT5C type [Alicyclobacillus ferrooxydans]|uniref:5'-3'-deoxyribonucleotidase n=1 Tax=Alicyclobacillus ferrooxydans TaxID=471514 RepID=A0A0P9CK75_9BACL|nr:5'-3'-deoxyribonucleotidase [Alicyclobacillus ferrooxydans]KPV43419.1 5'-3'-deoxyribonucleotidase [Alicyclobacillus ferrooxydans]
MKRIAIDMDEVIADFAGKHIKLYNALFSDSLTTSDLEGHRLWTLRPHQAKDILEILNDPMFFRDLDVIEGSQEVIAELSEQYEIFIATAAMERPSSFAAKFEWLKEHFPFLSDSNFVFCGDKSIIHADYLIDDSVRHFKRFVGQGILYSAPHNIHETGYVRVKDWEEVRAHFLPK